MLLSVESEVFAVIGNCQTPVCHLSPDCDKLLYIDR